MRRIVIFCTLIIFLCSMTAFATNQEKEVLLYNFESLKIEEFPLETYFSEQNPRPDFHVTADDFCTAGRRGYKGYWDVREGYLYLVNLSGPCSIPVNVPMLVSKIFSDVKLPIKATWFSGTLHAGYKEKMLELVFENGKLIKEEIKDWPTATQELNSKISGSF